MVAVSLLSSLLIGVTYQGVLASKLLLRASVCRSRIATGE